MDNILLLTLIIILVFGAIGIGSPLMTLYLESLGANYSRIALILATTASVSLVTSYAWGRLSDALGRRKPLIAAGLAGLALAYFLLSQVVSADWAWLVRLGEAASNAAYSTTSLALMGDLLATRDRRGQRMGVYRGLGSLAFAVGALLGGRLADHFSLRLTLQVCASLYLAAAAVALILRESRSATVRRSAPRIEAVSAPASAGLGGRRSAFGWKDRAAGWRGWRPGLPLFFLAGVFLWTMTWYGQASMWPNHMAALGYAKTEISSLWGLAALIEAPAMRFAGQWSDVVGRGALLAVGGFTATLVLCGYVALSQILPALVGVQVLRGVAFGSYTANAMTFAVEWGDETTRGRNSGLLSTVSGAGQLAGLLLGGTLAQAGGFRMMFGVFAATAAAAGACFLALRARAQDGRPVG